MRKRALIGLGILAGISVAALGYAQAGGVRAQAFAARRDAELLRVEQFAGAYAVTGTWDGEAVTGALRIRKKDGGYDVALDLKTGKKSIKAALRLAAGDAPTDLAATWSAGETSRKGTFEVAGRELRARIAVDQGDAAITMRTISREKISLDSPGGGGLPAFSLTGKRD